MKYAVVLCLVFSLSLLMLPCGCIAQNNFSFNLNVENGLPSNWVYGAITDRHGYLWIATEKGVVKYNGYESRLFNLSNGLSNEDVWELTEDRKGRIWLSNISDEFGYLYNDRYYKTVVKGKNNTIYPMSARDNGNGIVFTSIYLGCSGVPAMCFAYSDTIYSFCVSQMLVRDTAEEEHFLRHIFYNRGGQPIVLTDKRLYRISVTNTGIHYASTDVDSVLHDVLHKSKLYDNYFISFYASEKKRKLYALNLEGKQNKITSHQIESIDLDDYGVDGFVAYAVVDRYNKVFYVVSDHDVLAFDYVNGLKFRKKIRINDLTAGKEINGNKVRTILWDRFWGACLCTVNNGMWLSNEVNNNFARDDKLDLRDYVFMSRIKDSLLFFWNPRTFKVMMIENNRRVKYFSHKDLVSVNAIVHYNKDTFLLAGPKSYFLVNDGTERVFVAPQETLTWNLSGLILDSTGRYYYIDRQIFGIADKTRRPDPITIFDRDRYNDLVYDSTRDSYWAYNYNKVFIHKKNGDTIISREKLSAFGVPKIGKIVIDSKYGNIFFKGTNSITMYDPDSNHYKELFGNFNLKESSIVVYNNTLIITGRFGVLFSKIFGPMSISEPCFYPNLKNINYNNIYDCFASWNTVVLNTDKGIYSVNIPSDSTILNSKPDSALMRYRFMISYRDTTFRFYSGDTVTVNQNYRRSQFDVINPLGNGRLKYMYRFSDDSDWSELNANELTLPLRFRPGNYYRLYLKVYDNVWRSNEMLLVFYITPYWWQTYTGQLVIWSAVILVLMLLFVLAVLLTRKLVLNAAKKRSLRMELELKAIYAQINPHFIFNTLNSALLLVNKNKMEEAYTHISRFSRLLRAYIKSSRNKLITISEEITNLRDYIELQQTRFRNKFVYELHIDGSITPTRLMIPSLLIQPFVENAINHGLLPRQDMGRLVVEFKMARDKNEIICIIDDDGIGRRRSMSANENKDASYGDMLIKDLVNIFNKYEDMNIEISYTDKEEPLTGTIVIIQIKNPHHAE